MIDYHQLVQKAFLNVVKDVMLIAEVEGVPDTRPLTFVIDMSHPKFELSQRIRSRYPDGVIQLVLQHRWDRLHVFEDSFEVELSFDDIWETVVIPFEAILQFIDKAENFGFQFTGRRNKVVMVEESGEVTAVIDPGPAPEPKTAEVVSFADFKKK